MRKIVKASGVIVTLLVIVVAIPAFIPDEEYLPGASAWLEYDHVDKRIPDNLNQFNALVGFGVAEDKDMLSEGARLVAEANAAIDTAYQNQTVLPELDSYWDEPRLRTSRRLSGNVEDAFEADPAQWIVDNRDKFDEMLADNRVLLERFSVLINLEKYNHTLKLDTNTPFVRFGALTEIQQLNHLSIIDEFINSNQQAAIQRIQQSMRFARLMMAQSVLLVDKIFATKLLENDLSTYSVLLDHSPVDVASLNLTALQKDEMDMLNAIRGEYAYLSTSLYPENLNGIISYGGDEDFFETFLIRYYFKPRRMENHAYQNLWQPFLESQENSLSDREAMELTIFSDDISWWEIYTDPLGYFYAAVSVPNHMSYIAKIEHANAMITLLNLKAYIYARNYQVDDIENVLSLLDPEPSAGYAGAKFVWDADDQLLSYEIPGYSDEAIPQVKIKF